MSPDTDVGLGLVGKYEVLQSELTALIRYINETRRTLGGLHSELPAASDALSEVTRVTETAAHNLIDMVEQVLAQDEAASSTLERVKAVCRSADDSVAIEAVEQLAKLSDERTDLLIRMMTELSFQDLTCQTINQIARTIIEVERRVLNLIDDSALRQEGACNSSDEEALAGVSRLRETQSGESRQDMVDALLRGV